MDVHYEYRNATGDRATVAADPSNGNSSRLFTPGKLYQARQQFPGCRLWWLQDDRGHSRAIIPGDRPEHAWGAFYFASPLQGAR